MLPDLFSIGPFTVHGYGLMVALGVALAVYGLWRRAPEIKMPPDAVMDLAVWVVLAGVAGGRLLYVALSWRDYARDPLSVLKIWDGGLVFYGAFFGGLMALVWFLRRRRLPLWPFLDLAAPYVALAHAVGRVGCFLSGCCYGVPSPHGVVFPSLGDRVPRLPTQLYESAFDLALFFWLLAVQRRRRYDGQVFWQYIALYAAGRFVIEIFRGDEIRGALFFPWLHTSQLIALAILVVALAAWIRGHRQAAPPRS